MYSVTTNIHV
uniref:Uncharacterized protein n=1 Tax=Anguilla anguilla TaxID=7936 RepID=A0A0E9V689_ANGAN